MRSRSQLRRLVIQGYYNTSLVKQLYEQAAPAPADPAAPPATPADPAAAPAAAPADPAAAGATPPAGGAPPADPAAAGAASPMAAAPAGGAPPAADPNAPPPVPSAPAAPGAAPAAPAPGAAAPAAPGAAGAGEAAKKKAKAPDPVKEPVKSQVNKALMKATSAASKEDEQVATESLRRRSMRFLLEQEATEPKIDVDVYAGEIAKLIKNYTSLVDIKKNVITQAEEYLDDEFPKQADSLKKQLKDLLRKDYHISLERPEPPPDSYAVGAKGGGGGAA